MGLQENSILTLCGISNNQIQSASHAENNAFHLPVTNLTVCLNDADLGRQSCGCCISTTDSLFTFLLHTFRYQSSMDVLDGQSRRSFHSRCPMLPLIATISILSNKGSQSCPLLVSYRWTVLLQYVARRWHSQTNYFQSRTTSVSRSA